MQHNQCTICNSSELTIMSDYKKAHLCQCNNCGFIFSKEIPTKETLDNHYRNYGINQYLSPLTIKRYNQLLDKFEPYRKTNKILDIGCGIGYFLEEAKKRNWEVYGTEYSEESAKICETKGIKTHKGSLDSKTYRPEMFDIITSFEVIEHINNPQQELQQFHTIVRKGGLVYVTTPNFNSLLRYRLKSSYNVITYPEHLSYYTPKTLTKVFIASGFSKQKIETTGISITRFKTSKGISDQKIISAKSDDEKIRNRIETKWYLKSAQLFLNRSLSLFGVGDSIKGWFVKQL